MTYSNKYNARYEHSAYGRFHRQKQNAKTRGIEWSLSFEEWWAIWERSGKWEKRGRRRGGYVMARFGDKGPYAVGNVEIILARENIAYATVDRNRALPRGVYAAGKKYAVFTRINGKRVYLGCFPTPELAHAAYLAAVPEMEQAA